MIRVAKKEFVNALFLLSVDEVDPPLQPSHGHLESSCLVSITTADILASM
jgi:hypothetical protein